MTLFCFLSPDEKKQRIREIAKSKKELRLNQRLSQIMASIRRLSQNSKFPKNTVAGTQVWSKEILVGSFRVLYLSSLSGDLVGVFTLDKVPVILYVDQYHQYGSMLGYNDVKISTLSKVFKLWQALLELEQQLKESK